MAIKTSFSISLAALTAILGGASARSLAQAGGPPAAVVETQLETARLPQPVQRREFPLEGEESAFKFNFAEDGNVIDNDAVLQLQVTKAANPFLSTLPKDGLGQFLTVLKPCGILLPHVHQRSSEFYSVIFGEMSAGIAQENNNLQNITFSVKPGETFVVPQGLLHYNHNQQCVPNVFFQSFDSADAGALNVIGALAAFNNAGTDGAAAIAASGAESIVASPQGAFALDEACLARCGWGPSGAPGNGLEGLSEDFMALFGLTSA